jgi:hypothetical protein
MHVVVCDHLLNPDNAKIIATMQKYDKKKLKICKDEYKPTQNKTNLREINVCMNSCMWIKYIYTCVIFMFTYMYYVCIYEVYRYVYLYYLMFNVKHNFKNIFLIYLF